MKVLGILGSPRIGGNTDILLDKVLEGAGKSGAETEKICLNQLKFTFCQECEGLKDNTTCIFNDDMQIVYEKIKECDFLVIASPVFFGSLSAQTKAMIDRFQCAWRAKYILKKDIGFKAIKGVFISVEGSQRRDFFKNASSIVKNFFATINVKYTSELFCSGVDEKGDILKKPDCLKKAVLLGQSLK